MIKNNLKEEKRERKTTYKAEGTNKKQVVRL